MAFFTAFFFSGTFFNGAFFAGAFFTGAFCVVVFLGAALGLVTFPEAFETAFLDALFTFRVVLDVFLALVDASGTIFTSSFGFTTRLEGALVFETAWVLDETLVFEEALAFEAALDFSAVFSLLTLGFDTTFGTVLDFATFVFVNLLDDRGLEVDFVREALGEDFFFTILEDFGSTIFSFLTTLMGPEGPLGWEKSPASTPFLKAELNNESNVAVLIWKWEEMYFLTAWRLNG